MAESIAEKAKKSSEPSRSGKGVFGSIAPIAQEPLSVWERVSFGLAHAATSGLLLVLGLRGLYRFGQAFGILEWSLDYKRRRRFSRALTRVLGRKPTRSERWRHTRLFFMRMRCDKMFYLIFDRIPRERAVSLFSISDQDAFDGALGRGRGVYLAVCHHGSQHVLAMFLALIGQKPAGVRDRKEGGLRRYIQKRFDDKYPEFRRMRVLYSDSYPRDIFRCFEEGYVVGSAMDISRLRSGRQKTEDVTVFGERRPFLSGPLRIAMRSETVVLQAFVISEPGFHYRLEIVETLFDPQTRTDDAQTLSAAMQTYASNLERFVSESPSQLSRI